MVRPPPSVGHGPEPFPHRPHGSAPTGHSVSRLSLKCDVHGSAGRGDESTSLHRSEPRGTLAKGLPLLEGGVTAEIGRTDGRTES